MALEMSSFVAKSGVSFAQVGPTIDAQVLAMKSKVRIAQVSSLWVWANTAKPPITESIGITVLVEKRSAIVPAMGEKIMTGNVPTIKSAATAAGPSSFSRNTRVNIVSSVPKRLKPLASAIVWIFAHCVFAGSCILLV